MKAISIRQPWAWMIVEGYKDVENREWFTKFRGDILIHASKGCTKQEYANAVDFVKSFAPDIAARIPALDALNKGGLVGMARITGCVSDSKSPWFVGKFGFTLENRYPLPFRPMRGMLGLFNINESGLPEELP